MHRHRLPSPPAARRTWCAFGLALAGVLALCGILSAREDLPVFRQGMWSFSRVVNGKPVESTRCTNPTDDMKRQNASLQKAGCTFSPVKKSGTTYTFDADCAIKMPAIKSHSTSTLTAESDSAYRLEVTGTTDGQPTKESLVARRVGDCTAR
jgi:hypothetical protein